jgi:hypothetical protein
MERQHLVMMALAKDVETLRELALLKMSRAQPSRAQHRRSRGPMFVPRLVLLA